MKVPAMMHKKLQLQRQSSDDTESSCCSRSKAHRRTPPFIGAIQFGSSEEEDAWRHNLDVSFRSATGGTSSSLVHKEDKCSPESKIHLKHRLGDDNDDDNKTLRALELIRELSFDSGTEPKRRARIDTSSTDRTSSSSECDTSSQTDTHHNGTDHIDTSPIGLDLKLKHILQSRMDSPSPLVGLQYLPEMGGQYTDHFV
jgi:hypothetical protein